MLFFSLRSAKSHGIYLASQQYCKFNESTGNHIKVEHFSIRAMMSSFQMNQTSVQHFQATEHTS